MSFEWMKAFSTGLVMARCWHRIMLLCGGGSVSEERQTALQSVGRNLFFFFFFRTIWLVFFLFVFFLEREHWCSML